MSGDARRRTLVGSAAWTPAPPPTPASASNTKKKRAIRRMEWEPPRQSPLRSRAPRSYDNVRSRQVPRPRAHVSAVGRAPRSGRIAPCRCAACASQDTTRAERRQPSDQREHRAHEQSAREPAQVGREEFLDEERNDHDADEQRGAGTEVDRPAREPAPALEVDDLLARRAAHRFVHLVPRMLDRARAVDDAGETRRHHAEQSGDAGEKEYGGNRELNRVGDDRHVVVGRHRVARVPGLRAAHAQPNRRASTAVWRRYRRRDRQHCRRTRQATTSSGGSAQSLWGSL